MYVITVARAVEAGQTEPIALSVIAEALLVSVASANEMVRKLASRGIMTYEPYHGAGLTEAGWVVAHRVLRTRRLWATFLASQLGFSPTEADDQACHLEHATSSEAVDRLAAFLGDPKADPLGAPIPSATDHRSDRVEHVTLNDVAAGFEAEVVAVGATGAARDFLGGEGLSVGARIAVMATGVAGVLVDGGSPVHLTRELSSLIDVRILGRRDAS